MISQMHDQRSYIYYSEEVRFTFETRQIPEMSSFYAYATIIVDAPGWSTCNIGKNSPAVAKDSHLSLRQNMTIEHLLIGMKSILSIK
jgi:hypothetical protein